MWKRDTGKRQVLSAEDAITVWLTTSETTYNNSEITENTTDQSSSTDEAAATVKVSMTVTDSGTNKTLTLIWGCVEYNGKWYIYPPGF